MSVIWIPILIIAVIIAIPFIKSQKEMKKYYEGPEALEWLKNNKNPFALASNNFASTADAIDFVEELYDAGAELVIISQKNIRDDDTIIKEEGGPYSDAMVVKLSADMLKRKKILNVCAERADPDYGTNLDNEVKDNMLFLWWD